MADFVIGQKVAIYRSHFAGGSFTEASVERDTKLYWVADGRKFRKRDGIEPSSRNSWERPARLLHLSDPRIQEAKDKYRKDLAYGAVLDAQKGLGRDRENLKRIEALKVALDAYAEVLK